MSEDPNDQLLLQLPGAVAEYERSLIAERMRRGKTTQVSRRLALAVDGATLWLSPRSRPSSRPFGRAGGTSRRRDRERTGCPLCSTRPESVESEYAPQAARASPPPLGKSAGPMGGCDGLT